MERPVEVVARIRRSSSSSNGDGSCLTLLPSGTTLRLGLGEAKGGDKFKQFELDGVLVEEDLQVLYHRFVQKRVEEALSGEKATILMYGSTGTGKTYAVFGFASDRQPGILYVALSDLMQGGSTTVVATVVEIYNEEIYDLLGASNNKHRRKLDIRAGRVKNAVTISSNDAAWLSRRIEAIENLRSVKNTYCNERSSRSHCVVILEVPSVGGSLVFVDMAGSENVERAGLSDGSHLQSGKINQGNGALKRVVEAIANEDAYIPYRDSKLTMLLQESFRSKILMVLCMRSDPEDMHRCMSTLEYGAKAKCITTVVKSKSGSRRLQMMSDESRAKDEEIARLRELITQRRQEIDGLLDCCNMATRSGM